MKITQQANSTSVSEHCLEFHSRPSNVLSALYDLAPTHVIISHQSRDARIAFWFYLPLGASHVGAVCRAAVSPEFTNLRHPAAGATVAKDSGAAALGKCSLSISGTDPTALIAAH
ncbi:hypothetical protein C0Q70_19875 [Pomacea canaliculata]|uniref:Uncharacterized protein n=1 Tax=Pomacea canaliculata TaxID=400727 RepID=A0A2T7NDZ1_POMCA|nr:hypothetical protein C0Q70_19875 [Pomacea canaliculata]